MNPKTNGINNPDIQMKYRPKKIYPSGNSPKNILSKAYHQKQYSDYQMITPEQRDNEKIIHRSIKRNFDPEGNAIITTKIVREIDYNDNKNNLNSNSIMNIRPKAMNASFQRNNEQQNKILRYSNYSKNEEMENNNGIYTNQNYGYQVYSPDSYESHENNYTKINTYSGRGMESDSGKDFYSGYRNPGMGNIINMERSEISQGMANYSSGSDYEEPDPSKMRKNTNTYMNNPKNLNYSQKIGLNKVKYRRYNLESPSYSQGDDFDSPDRNYEYSIPYFRNIQIDKIKGIQPIYHEKMNMMKNQFETSGEYEQIINKSRKNYDQGKNYITSPNYRQGPESIEDTIDIINEKAIQIQSYVRGFLVRKKVLRYITLAIYYQSFCDKIQDALCCHVREEVFRTLKNKLRGNKYGKRGRKEYYSNNNKRKNHLSTKNDNSTDKNNLNNRNEKETKGYDIYNRNKFSEKKEYREFKQYMNTPPKSIREYENISFNRTNRTNKNICKKNNLNYSANYTSTEYKKFDYTVSPTKKVTHYYISSPCSHNKPHQRYYQEIDGKDTNLYRNKLNTYRSYKNINELKNFRNYDYSKYKFENNTSKMLQEKPDFKSGIGTRSISRGMFKTTYSSSNQNIHKCHCLDGIRKRNVNLYRENTENNYNVRKDYHIIRNYDIKRDVNTHRLIRKQERSFNRFNDDEIESDNYLSLNIVKIPHRRVSSTGKKEEIITKTVATKEYVEDKNKNLLQKEEPQKRKRFSKIEMNKAETVRIMPLIKKEEKSKSVSTREIFTNTITQPNEVTQIEAINIKAKKELKKEIIVPKVDKEKEKRDKERLEIEIERRVKERVEIEKKEIERIDRERKDKERKDRLEKEKRDREKEKQDKEKREQEEQLLIKREKQIQIEQEKIIRERRDIERREKEAQRKREKEEKERKDWEEQERIEKEKRLKEEQDRRDREKKDRERRDKMDRERREREKKEMEQLLIIEREKIIKEETERIEKEIRERERKEKEARLKRERDEKLRKEKEEKDRLERQKQLEEERKERERKEKERKDKLEREKREKERKGREEQKRIEREKKRKEEQERIERERREKERKEREEKLRIEREERIRKEKIERERIEREKEREIQEKERKNKIERKIEKERIERERKEKEKKDKEAQLKKEKEERDRLQKIQIEKTKIIEKERIKRLEDNEKERKERLEKRLQEQKQQQTQNIAITTTKKTTTTKYKQETDKNKGTTTKVTTSYYKPNIQTVKVKEHGGGKYPSFGPGDEYILKKDCQKNLNEMKLKLEKEYEQKIEMEKRRGKEELRINQENMEKKNKKEIERIMELHKQQDNERLREIEREKEIVRKRELELEKLKEKEVKIGIQIETEKQREMQRQKEIEERNKKNKMIRIHKEIEINLKNEELSDRNQYIEIKEEKRDREKDIERAKEIIRIFILARCDPKMKKRKHFNVWRRKTRYLELLEYSKVIQEFCRANLEMSNIKKTIKNWKNLSKKLYYKTRIKLLRMRPKLTKVNSKRKKLYELLRITRLTTIFSRRRFIHFIILIWHIYAKNIHRKRVNMRYLYENLLKTYMSLANDIFGNNQIENPSVQDAMYEAVNTNKFITLYPDDVPLARKHYEQMKKMKSADTKDRGIYQGSKIVKSATTTKLEIEKKEVQKKYYMGKINEKEENNSESDDENRKNEAKRRKLDFLAKYRKNKLYNQNSTDKKQNNYSNLPKYGSYDNNSLDKNKIIKNTVDTTVVKNLYTSKNVTNKYSTDKDDKNKDKTEETKYTINKYVKTEGNYDKKNEAKTVENESTNKYGNLYKNRNKSDNKDDKKPTSYSLEKKDDTNYKTKFGNNVNVIYSSNLKQETITSNRSDKSSNNNNNYQKKYYNNLSYVSNTSSQKENKDPTNYNINIKKESVTTKPVAYDTYQKKVYVKTTTEEPKVYSKKTEIKTTTTSNVGNKKTNNITSYIKDDNKGSKYGSRENIKDTKKLETKPELHKSNTEGKINFVYKSQHYNTDNKNVTRDIGTKVYEKKVEIKPYKSNVDNSQETKKVVITKSYKSSRYNQ